MWRKTERQRRGKKMKGLIVTLIIVGAFLGGCATSSSERGPAKCPVFVGQSEEEFLQCGCFWPYLSSTPAVQLNDQLQTPNGITKVYACRIKGLSYYIVTVINGKVYSLAGPYEQQVK